MAMSVGTSDSGQSQPTSTTAATTTTTTTINNNNTPGSSTNRGRTVGKKPGKRPGRKPAKIDERAKLEKSRQSAKECRARKKLRYQYLEELVLNREKAVFTLRDELEMFKQWCIQLDRGQIPDKLVKMIANEEMARQRRQAEEMRRQAEVSHRMAQGHPHHQTPSTSSSTQRVYSSSSSPSSSSSSPPQQQLSEVSASSYQQRVLQSPRLQQPQQSQPQQQPMMPTRLPPPPYPQAPATTSARFTLTRQSAFDESSGSQQFIPTTNPSSQKPQQHLNPPPHHHPQQTRFIPQQQQRQQSSPAQQQFLNPQTGSLPKPGSTVTVSSPKTQHTNIQLYPQNNNYQIHKQSLPAKRFQPTQQQQQEQMPGQPVAYQPVTEVKNEPVIFSCDNQPSLDDISDFICQETKRTQSGDVPHSNQFGTVASTSATATSGVRLRSLSNPASLMSLHRQSYPALKIGQRDATSTWHSYNPSGNNSFPSVSTPAMAPSTSKAVGNQLGIFSGIPISCSNVNVPSAITVEESDSSDENNYTGQLFQSSCTDAQNRTLSDLSMLGKKAKSLDAEMDSLMNFFSEGNQSSAPFCSVSNLTHLTTAGSSSGSLNTPSVSPFGVVPRNTDSPMTTASDVTLSPAPSTHSSHTNVTPSSSTNPSPAPASSFSSFLDNANTMTSAPMTSAPMECDIVTTLASTPTIENFLSTFSSQDTSSPVICSETGLRATISEPIPEWFSLISELQVDNCPVQQQASVSSYPQNDQQQRMTFDQKQFQQFSQTGAENFLFPQAIQKEELSSLNVPSIIEELSNSGDSV